MTNFKSISYKGDSLTCVRGDRTVFTGLDFNTSAGEMLVLKGHNGSGKSSLLRVMAGLIRPRHGSLILDGIDASDDPVFHRKNITYAGHQAGLKPLMSLRENLIHYTRITGHQQVDESEIKSAADSLNLLHLVGEQLRYFSQGQTHRAALLKLILAKRPIWLMDEPTVGLDADSRSALVTVMSNHLGSGGIIIVATHDPLGLSGAELNLDAFQSDEHLIDHWLDEEDTLEGTA